MLHLIENKVFSKQHERELIKALSRLELDWEYVNVKPFIDTLEFSNTERTDIMPWGSTKLSRIGKNMNWNPGSFLNDNFNYEVYSTIYNDYLFNHDSKIYDFYSLTNSEISNLSFVRPVLDNKMLNGKVYTKEELISLRDYHKRQSKLANNAVEKGLLDDHSWKSFNIQIAQPKPLTKEFRFWCINSEIVTGSLYRNGQFIHFTNIVDEPALNFAKEMVKIWQPAQAFVIDIVESSGKYYIMEFGCINSAGFYDCNLQLLLNKLEAHFND